MTGDELVTRLYVLGHFWSPPALAAGGADPARLHRLRPDDHVVREALRSYQGWFAEQLGELAAFHHGRAAVADGELGPATAELLSLPRCAVPDFRPPGAEASGNWPDACRAALTTSYQMTLRGLSAARMAALWSEGDGNWERTIDVRMRLTAGSFPRTSIYARAEPMSGGLLAYQQLAVGRCDVHLRGAFNSNTNWSEALFVTTVTHEHGHGLGFDHQRDPRATMYPSITAASQARRGVPNATDLAEARRAGYRLRAAAADEGG